MGKMKGEADDIRDYDRPHQRICVNRKNFYERRREPIREISGEICDDRYHVMPCIRLEAYSTMERVIKKKG